MGPFDAGASVLLLAPPLLSYVLLRPREHVLVGGFLVYLRRVLIASGFPPVLGATALAVSREGTAGRGRPATHTELLFVTSGHVLWIAAGLATLFFLLFLFIRIRRRGATTPLSTSEAAAAPDPQPEAGRTAAADAGPQPQATGEVLARLDS